MTKLALGLTRWASYKVKALGSSPEESAPKEELRFIEEARRALIDWGVACEPPRGRSFISGAAKVVYVDGTAADTASGDNSEAIGAATKPPPLGSQQLGRDDARYWKRPTSSSYDCRTIRTLARRRRGDSLRHKLLVDGLDDALTRYGHCSAFKGLLHGGEHVRL